MVLKILNFFAQSPSKLFCGQDESISGVNRCKIKIHQRNQGKAKTVRQTKGSPYSPRGRVVQFVTEAELAAGDSRLTAQDITCTAQNKSN